MPAMTPESGATSKPAVDRGRRSRRMNGDDREKAILVTAERLLAELPFSEISVDDLATGAGISRPTFYFYFPSKEAVLLTLLDRVVDEARSKRGDVLELLEDDPKSAWRDALGAIYMTFKAHKAVTVAAAELAGTSPAVRALWEDVMETFVAETTIAIESERARGAAPAGRPPRQLAIALNWMNERTIHSSIASQQPALDDHEVLDVLADIWLKAVYGPDMRSDR
jgi:AcrR family transcriptional regulator